MVLLYLLTLALLVQTTTQESQEWRDEQKSFEQKAKNFFKRKLPDLKILDFRFSGFDKCPHKAARNPYGVAKLRLRVSCPHGIPANCGLYSTRHDRTEVLVVDCQYAGEVTSYGHGRILAALCYQNTTRGIRRIGEEIAAEGLCKKWRYPGTELPQLEVPEHLKSPHSSLLLYQVANSESFSGPYSPETAAHWPRNPYERTGFGGKGKLEEYGANMALYLLITRYSYGTTKVLIEDSDNSTALPRFWVKKDKIDADLIKRKVSKLTKYCKGSEINLMVKTRQKYHTGYLKNKHNTDNAWLEGAIIHLHDQSDQGCFGPYPVHADVQSRQYRWQVLSDSTTPRDFALTFVANYKESHGKTKVLIEDTEDYTALPQFWVKKGTIDDDFIKRKLLKLNTYCKESEIGLMASSGHTHHTGYLKNKHNTDNAWLEGTIVHVHDETGACFSKFPVHATATSRRYKWHTLSHGTTIQDFADSVANYK